MIRVVIVEDETVLRKGLARLTPWEDFGALVIAEASNGLEGVELILRLTPDIVITDIRMPGLSGIEMMRRVKGSCDPEFIIISSYGEFAYAQEAIELGAKGYIMKPIDDEELAAVLRRTIHVVNAKKASRMLQDTASHITFNEYLAVPGDDYREKYLEAALSIIKDHYRENLKVQDVAESLNISESSFSKLFKTRTGYTFLEYLTFFRMKKAVALLDIKETRINEVAAMSGYADYRHFSELFKKTFGISPSDYRKGKLR